MNLIPIEDASFGSLQFFICHESPEQKFGCNLSSLRTAMFAKFFYRESNRGKTVVKNIELKVTNQN